VQFVCMCVKREIVGDRFVDDNDDGRL
jgi:hypothetical protein